MLAKLPSSVPVSRSARVFSVRHERCRQTVVKFQVDCEPGLNRSISRGNSLCSFLVELNEVIFRYELYVGSTLGHENWYDLI